MFKQKGKNMHFGPADWCHNGFSSIPNLPRPMFFRSTKKKTLKKLRKVEANPKILNLQKQSFTTS